MATIVALDCLNRKARERAGRGRTVPSPADVFITGMGRAANDTGLRGSLDDTIAAFGFNRVELEGELDADLAAGRG